MKTRKKLLALILSALMTVTLLAGFAVPAGAVGDDATMIFVDGNAGTGGDGSQGDPYGTIDPALADLTVTRNIIYILNQVTISGSTIITSNVPGAIIRRSDNYARGILFVIASATGSDTVAVGGRGGAIVIDGNNAANAGSIFQIDSGTLAITTGATLQNNAGNAAGGGGAVYVGGGALTMDGGTLIGNSSGDPGGAINIVKGTATISGGTIQNSTASRGGAINVGAGTMLTVSGTTQIIGNTARNTGGGILARGTFNFQGGIISGNTAESGGGVSVMQTGIFNFTGGSITDNTTTVTRGGGIFITTGATGTMSGGTIAHNTAKSDGGGVYVGPNGTQFTQSGGTIGGTSTGDENSAVNGGGVYVDADGTYTLTGGTITGNTATGDGNGVYVTPNSTVSLTPSGQGTIALSDTVYLGYDSSSSVSANLSLNGVVARYTIPLRVKCAQETGSVVVAICPTAAFATNMINNSRIIYADASKTLSASGVNVITNP
jgi:predicted outer membrane repeat protein